MKRSNKSWGTSSDLCGRGFLGRDGSSLCLLRSNRPSNILVGSNAKSSIGYLMDLALIGICGGAGKGIGESVVDWMDGGFCSST